LQQNHIVATPAFKPWWNQHFTWSFEDDEKLKILADAGADLDRSAPALGRSSEALIWHARKLGIAIPGEWPSGQGSERPR
jgi:hypothetical protein